MEALVAVLVFIAAVFCGVIATEVGAAKDRSPVAWFIAGFVFGPLGMLAAWAVPVLGDRCNHCYEIVRTGANVCPHCTRPVEERNVEIRVRGRHAEIRV